MAECAGCRRHRRRARDRDGRGRPTIFTAVQEATWGLKLGIGQGPAVPILVVDSVAKPRQRIRPVRRLGLDPGLLPLAGAEHRGRWCVSADCRCRGERRHGVRGTSGLTRSPTETARTGWKAAAPAALEVSMQMFAPQRREAAAGTAGMGPEAGAGRRESERGGDAVPAHPRVGRGEGSSEAGGAAGRGGVGRDDATRGRRLLVNGSVNNGRRRYSRNCRRSGTTGGASGRATTATWG